MTSTLVLASGSTIRAEMLTNAGLSFDVVKPRVDEEALKAALLAEGTKPRDLADALAEMKAQRVAMKARPEQLVIGSDQVLEIEGEVLSKPADRDEAAAHLRRLSGKPHMLHSAAVIFEDNRPVWRAVSTVRLRVRDLSDSYIKSYLDRNWPEVGYCVGAYQVEAEGIRLFSRIDGEYFAILGLPLLDLLNYLTVRGLIET
ncbi:Maf family protein [Pseudooceanicola nanhaiensis]|uniref:Maf family protein n=1 Tax=Pseudooceanicola nanhaiensis TaxID=375761 RepID=UPI001CD59C5C|nr:Maf family nucleotide pyrophosphatase [Pseudooceanicola nanhaiensis]MCA0920270.1 Maf family nucleotide pyrophosphatase [Pseudooceanicola nanhaiensis]